MSALIPVVAAPDVRPAPVRLPAAPGWLGCCRGSCRVGRQGIQTCCKAAGRVVCQCVQTSAGQGSCMVVARSLCLDIVCNYSASHTSSQFGVPTAPPPVSNQHKDCTTGRGLTCPGGCCAKCSARLKARSLTSMTAHLTPLWTSDDEPQTEGSREVLSCSRRHGRIA
jgi:hypothetical protein